jgi:hypothetical protein
MQEMVQSHNWKRRLLKQVGPYSKSTLSGVSRASSRELVAARIDMAPYCLVRRVPILFLMKRESYARRIAAIRVVVDRMNVS